VVHVRFVRLQEVGDHVLGVVGDTVELGAVEVEVSRRHVAHGLGVTVSHERRQTRQSAPTTHQPAKLYGYSSSQRNSNTATPLRELTCHVGSQCYLPPDRADIPAPHGSRR